SAGLRMEAQSHSPGIGGAERLHDPRPHSSRRTEFSHLFEKIVMRIEEKGQAFAEDVDIEAFFHRRPDIGLAVAEGKGDLLYGRAPGFTDMVARDGDGIPFRQFAAAPF